MGEMWERQNYFVREKKEWTIKNQKINNNFCFTYFEKVSIVHNVLDAQV